MKWASLLLFFLTLPLVFNAPPLEILRLKTFDALVETPEPTGYFTILNIDEQYIDDQGGYPLPRKTLADIHLQLLQKGALGVGWVMLFPHPDRLGGDESARLVVAGSMVLNTESHRTEELRLQIIS